MTIAKEIYMGRLFYSPQAENERKVDALLEEKDTCLARHHHLEQNMTAMLKEEAKLRGTISSQQTHIQGT